MPSPKRIPTERVTYPRIHALGLTVEAEPIPHIPRDVLKAALVASGRWNLFRKLFPRFKTQLAQGPYAWDVEMVLSRMDLSPEKR